MLTMMSKTFKVSLSVDASGFYRHIEDMNKRTGDKVLKQILRDVGTKVLVPKLRSEAVSYSRYQYSSPTNNLRKSFGNITGKRGAIVFVGPRMATGGERGMGFKGWVTNILENVQGPKMKSAPGPRRRSRFRQVHRSSVSALEKEIFNSVKRVLERRWR